MNTKRSLLLSRGSALEKSVDGDHLIVSRITRGSVEEGMGAALSISFSRNNSNCGLLDGRIYRYCKRSGEFSMLGSMFKSIERLVMDDDYGSDDQVDVLVINECHLDVAQCNTVVWSMTLRKLFFEISGMVDVILVDSQPSMVLPSCSWSEYAVLTAQTWSIWANGCFLPVNEDSFTLFRYNYSDVPTLNACYHAPFSLLKRMCDTCNPGQISRCISEISAILHEVGRNILGDTMHIMDEWGYVGLVKRHQPNGTLIHWGSGWKDELFYNSLMKNPGMVRKAIPIFFDGFAGADSEEIRIAHNHELWNRGNGR